MSTASYGDGSDENPLYTANVIANPKLRIGDDDDRCQRRSRQELLADKLHEAGESKPMSRPAITRSSSCCGARI